MNETPPHDAQKKYNARMWVLITVLYIVCCVGAPLFWWLNANA